MVVAYRFSHVPDSLLGFADLAKPFVLVVLGYKRVPSPRCN